MDKQKPRRRRAPQEINEIPQETKATEVTNPPIAKENRPVQPTLQKSPAAHKKTKKDQYNPLLIAATIIEGLIIALLILAITLFTLNGWTDGGVIGLINGVVSTPTPIPSPTYTPIPTPTPTPQVEYVYITPQPTFTQSTISLHSTEVDVNILSDEELTTLLEEANNLVNSISKEQINRDYERAVTSLENGSSDLVLKAYEGVYQAYSTVFGFEEDFIVIKDGILYDYSFYFEDTGGASLNEWNLVSYDVPLVGTLYCDKEHVMWHLKGEKWLLNSGVKISVSDDGYKCLEKYYLSSEDEWYKSLLDGDYIPVPNVTKEELDKRYLASVNKPDPAIGMTAEEVIISTWGFPLKKNKTVTAYGVDEQWVYDDGYIYLTNGIVTSIQY